MSETKYDRLALVIEEGDAGDHFYLVYTGSFEAYAAKVADGKAPKLTTRTGDAPPEDGEVEVKLNELGCNVLQIFNEGDGARLPAAVTPGFPAPETQEWCARALALLL